MGYKSEQNKIRMGNCWIYNIIYDAYTSAIGDYGNNDCFLGLHVI